MEIFSRYSEIIVNSFLKLKEGDALSINTEECDFAFAKVIADMAVRTTKTVAKIVLTENGRPSEVVDFDPYETPVPTVSYCMLHLNHVDDTKESGEGVLDIIVDKDDFKSLQKLGHLADPIILDRRIAIPWCVIPSYNINSSKLEDSVDNLSNELDSQILSAKYRTKFLNHEDIDKLHFYSESCDFTVELPDNSCFVSGVSVLGSGREFITGPDFGNLLCNVDKNSLNGWFNADIKILGKNYKAKLTFSEGRLSKVEGCDKLHSLLEFDNQLSLPGYIKINDKHFEIVFGGALVDSLSKLPDSIEELPSWFNDCVYKFSCLLDDKLNVEYFGCDNIAHELVRKGFFLE